MLYSGSGLLSSGREGSTKMWRSWMCSCSWTMQKIELKNVSAIS